MTNTVHSWLANGFLFENELHIELAIHSCERAVVAIDPSFTDALASKFKFELI